MTHGAEPLSQRPGAVPVRQRIEEPPTRGKPLVGGS